MSLKQLHQMRHQRIQIWRPVLEHSMLQLMSLTTHGSSDLPLQRLFCLEYVQRQGGYTSRSKLPQSLFRRGMIVSKIRIQYSLVSAE